MSRKELMVELEVRVAVDALVDCILNSSLGGGSGGTIWLGAPQPVITGTVRAMGGSGGAPLEGGTCGISAPGGQGSYGYIFIQALDFTSVAGSVSPNRVARPYP